MTIRSGGLASGLDTNALIDQLVALERIPIDNLGKKVTNQTTQISTIGKVKAALQKIQDKAKGLESVDKIFVTKGTSSSDSSFTVTTAAAAKPATYDVEVLALAKAAKMRSVAIPTATPAVKGGELTFAVQGGDPVTITIEVGDSLEAVASTINAKVGGVSASVIDDGTNKYLSVTTKETGHTIGQPAASALTITENYTGSTGTELGLTTTQSAQNASVKVDGITVTNKTNSVSSAVAGVTFELKAQTTSAQTATVTVDQSAMETKIKEFVDAYNEAVDLLVKETTITESTDRTKSLAGDTTMRSIRGNLSNTVTGQISSLLTKSFDSLSAIGIKTAATGKLATDSTALKAALAKDPDGVANVFTAPDGASKRIQEGLKVYTGPQGILKARTDGLAKSNTAINEQMDKLTLRIDSYKQKLIRTYTQLETAVSAIQGQQQYINQIT